MATEDEVKPLVPLVPEPQFSPLIPMVTRKSTVTGRLIRKSPYLVRPKIERSDEPAEFYPIKRPATKA